MAIVSNDGCGCTIGCLLIIIICCLCLGMCAPLALLAL